MTACDLCRGERFVTYAGGEDRPCTACNADFHERSQEPCAVCNGTGQVACWNPGGPCESTECELCGPCNTCEVAS